MSVLTQLARLTIAAAAAVVPLLTVVLLGKVFLTARPLRIRASSRVRQLSLMSRAMGSALPMSQAA